ncbi:AraC family transcriptional regulator [Vibrio sp. NTOU-M3]|uniref:AraC family transcriptional regulator n=1 Tax=Vibrio sp. NTOU-M3 TaxID=3234954 RepID=UPI00349F19F6
MKKDVSACFKRSTQLPNVELRIADRSTACYQAHSHDEFSFGVIDDGQALYANRKRQYHVRKGDIVTINPSDVHACNPQAGDWSYRMLFVDARWMGEIQQEVVQSQQQDYFAFEHDLERRLDLSQTFNQLFAALYHDNSTLNAEILLFEFVAGCSALASEPKVASMPLLHQVKEKLLDQVDSNHQLDDLAKDVDMNRYQLLRAFKHQYGLPPHAFLMDEKIKRAKVLLRQGYSLTETALQLGFSDQAHFQRQFKKKAAVTPKFYQSHFI